LISITGNGTSLGRRWQRDQSRSRLIKWGSVVGPANPASAYSYNISSNGAAGDWYWEVISRGGKIIARGLSATEALARARAMRAALSHVDLRPENLPPYLQDPLPPLPRFGAT